MVDIGTLGGPQAFFNLPGVPIARNGDVLATGDTTEPDTDFPNFNPFIVGFADPSVARAFTWREGRRVDLGALPGNNSSAVFEINRAGVGAGMSETGALDPLTGYPAEHAVIFRNGAVTDLGTLPGGNESQALAINSRGQVTGFGSNGVPDPVSVFGWGTQTRGFVWQDGVMRDLGSLGGPDTTVTTLNERGQIAGDSFTNATPNPTTGAPTSHPYLWEDGHMRDLGTLGGTQSSTNWMNSRGEVVGQGSLAGDQSAHPFLWDGGRLRDLGTLGGSFGSANYINRRGDVVGWATPAGDTTAHAFLWKDGVMTDLTGPDLTQCTIPEALNNRNQVVGNTCAGSPVLWDRGTQYELNDLVTPSAVRLTEAAYIDDDGRILSAGRLPSGDQHMFLLTRTTDHHTGAGAVSSGGHVPQHWAATLRALECLGKLRRPDLGRLGPCR